MRKGGMGLNKQFDDPLKEFMAGGRVARLAVAPVLHGIFTVARFEGCGARDIDFRAQHASLVMLFRERSGLRSLSSMADRPGDSCMKDCMSIIDLRSGATIGVHGEFDVLCIHTPHELLCEVMSLSDDLNRQRLRPVWNVADAVMANLGRALSPLLQNPDFPSHSLLRYISVAVCAHLLHRYGAGSGQHLH